MKFFLVKIFWVQIFLMKIFLSENYFGKNFLGENIFGEIFFGWKLFDKPAATRSDASDNSMSEATSMIPDGRMEQIMQLFKPMLQNFSAKVGSGFLHFPELVFSVRKFRKGGGVTPLVRNFFCVLPNGHSSKIEMPAKVRWCRRLQIPPTGLIRHSVA